MAKDKDSINEEVTLMQRVSDQMERTADSLQAVEKCVNKLDKKLDLHIQKMEYELKAINQLDKEQNELLAKHAARSEALQKDNELREHALRIDIGAQSERIDDLEAPGKWLKTTQAVVLKVGGAITIITGAIYGVVRLLGWF